MASEWTRSIGAELPVDGILYECRFTARAFEWRGPAPFLFADVPDEHVAELRYAAKLASFGWGVIPVEAEISGICFTTSLFPRDGGYLLPLKLTVQRATGIAEGSNLTVALRVREPRS